MRLPLSAHSLRRHDDMPDFQASAYAHEAYSPILCQDLREPRIAGNHSIASAPDRRHPPQNLPHRIALHVLIEQCLFLLLGDDA